MASGRQQGLGAVASFDVAFQKREIDSDFLKFLVESALHRVDDILRLAGCVVANLGLRRPKLDLDRPDPLVEAGYGVGEFLLTDLERPYVLNEYSVPLTDSGELCSDILNMMFRRIQAFAG